jgi:hypothetical protein
MPSNDNFFDLTKDDESENEGPRRINPRHGIPRSKTTQPEIIEISDSDSPTRHPSLSRFGSRKAPGKLDTRKRDGAHIEGETHTPKRVSTRPTTSGSRASTPLNVNPKSSPIDVPKSSAARSQGSIPLRPSTFAAQVEARREPVSQNDFPNLPGLNKCPELVPEPAPPPPAAQPFHMVTPSQIRVSRSLKALSKIGPEPLAGRCGSGPPSVSTPGVAEPSKQAKALSSESNDLTIQGLLIQEDHRDSQDRGQSSSDLSIDDKADSLDISCGVQNGISSSILPSTSRTEINALQTAAKIHHLRDNLDITTAEIEELLTEFAQEIRDNQAAAVNVLLRSARTRNQSAERFFDGVSPFAAMGSVEFENGNQKFARTPSVAIDSFVSATPSDITLATDQVRFQLVRKSTRREVESLSELSVQKKGVCLDTVL